MKYIYVEWSKGVTQIRSEPETGSEDSLTEQEQIINELHTKLKLLNIGDVSNNEVAVCSFEDKCCLYQESNCNQKTCGDFHKQTDC